MKKPSLIDILTEASTLILNLAQTLFYVATTSTALYASYHMHKLIPIHDLLKSFLEK